MDLETLRDDIAAKQKKGLPFILASVVIWTLITAVSLLKVPVMTRNLIVFCCSVPLLPLSMLAGKIIGVNIFDQKNPLGKLGFLFTMNQMLYLLIVMWVYSAVPEKMIMVHAMVFGAHLFPFSWLYKSKAYLVFSIFIPVAALLAGIMVNGSAVSAIMMVSEIIFAFILFRETRNN